MIEGLIEKKWSEKRTKGNRLYYIGLKDTVINKYFEFRVKKNVFNKIGKVGLGIIKEFKTGSLGVYYRVNF